jgi:hypothetical protein
MYTVQFLILLFKRHRKEAGAASFLLSKAEIGAASKLCGSTIPIIHKNYFTNVRKEIFDRPKVESRVKEILFREISQFTIDRMQCSA